jgi:type IV fimbrial biogenesis protein FimT
MKAPKRCGGVTLVELSTTLASAAIILTLGVPAFRALQTDRQLSQVSSSLTGSFALARSEAVRRGAQVRVCPSTDGSSCNSPPHGDWSTGWIVTVAEGSRGHVIDVTHPSPAPAFSLAADALLAEGVTFTSAGLPSDTGSLTYSDGRNHSVFRLTPIGRLDFLP